MHINKDEARILSAALATEKYNFINKIAESKEDASAKIKALMKLEHKLDAYALDKRRQGRRSQNDFSDLLKRYCKQQ